jgi:hypothetical protein
VADQRAAVPSQSLIPQVAPQSGPQMVYPGDPRTSRYAPAYVAPQYQPPSGPYPITAATTNPQPSVPWVGQAVQPRSLPPVERR